MGDENELDQSPEEQSDFSVNMDRQDSNEEENVEDVDDDGDALEDSNSDNVGPSRRSSRPSRASKVISTPKSKEPKTPEKRGQKRKSTASTGGETSAKSKIPKYEIADVSLQTKVVYIKESDARVFKDRTTLTTIPAKEGTFAVGDLIWAKMTGYPWWPCIITIDPVSGVYSKITGSSCKADRVYHVQYFGPEAYRGWTNIGMVMPFEGFEKFYDQISDEVENAPKAKVVKVLEKCSVKPGIRKKWNQSISEAELAMKLSQQERVELLTFIYTVKDGHSKEGFKSRKSAGASKVSVVGSAHSSASVTPKSGKKRKNSSAATSSAHKEPSSREDVYDFPEDSEDGLDENISPGTLSFRSRPIKGDFQVYLRKHFDEELKKNPNRSKAEIREFLKEEWDGLSEKIRETYTELKAILLDDSAMLVAKRSNFDDDYFNDDSDYDYNDSEDDKGMDIGDDSSSKKLVIAEAPSTTATTTVTATTKAKSSKSRKSEKLFDKIKNATESNGNGDLSAAATITSTSASEGTSKKRRSASSARATKEMATSATQRSQSSSRTSASKPTVSSTTSRSSQKSGDSSKADTEKNAAKKDRPLTGNIKRKLCFTDTSGDDTNSSDAASVNSEPIEPKRKSAPPDRFCHKCSNDETPTETLLTCEGVCQRMYHKVCVGLTDSQGESFLCEECTNEKHMCFACNNPDDLETKKCEDSKCGRFYHLSCIENNYPIRVNESANSFICPMHTCLTCHNETLEDREYRANNKKLVRCIWCPTAYHNEIFCIAAGTVRVSRNFIICPEHSAVENTSKRNDRHINVNYCFACLSGGNLICCESCPSAFHDECLEYTFDHDKSFYCGSCIQRKQLHYGDVVWVKLGSYRWWPSRICHPNIVPENVLNLNHSVGDFPVYFFGSHDYYWINKGRVYLYLEGDNQAAKASGNKNSNSKNLKVTFARALEEAEEAFISWTLSRKDMVKQTIANKPPPYQHIQSNRYLVQKSNGNGNSNESACERVCECKKGNFSCDDENCLNRVSFIECDPKLCPVGERCKNQRFRKCEYVKCKPFKTDSAGWGLMALEDVKEGQFIMEYCGEVIDEKECDRRLKKIASDQSNFYFLNLDKDLFIDAGPKGNLARFMNHSCEPNCITQKWVVNNATRVGLFALKDIPAETELTFNYNLDCRGNERTKCECGSSRCSGFIGERPRSDEPLSKRIVNGGKSSMKPKNSKQKMPESILHEKACFACGEGPGGPNPDSPPLVNCHFVNCPKSYHVKCLKPKFSSGIKDVNWSCPMHSCMKDNCNDPASSLCSACPNAYCQKHVLPFLNDLQLPDERLLCEDHRPNKPDELAESEFNGMDE